VRPGVSGWIRALSRRLPVKPIRPSECRRTSGEGRQVRQKNDQWLLARIAMASPREKVASLPVVHYLGPGDPGDAASVLYSRVLKLGR
jgi:hypothetical protein